MSENNNKKKLPEQQKSKHSGLVNSKMNEFQQKLASNANAKNTDEIPTLTLIATTKKK